jgi:hypothetical protein
MAGLAKAETIVVTKTDELHHQQSTSPFFTLSADGSTALAPANGWTPVAPTQAAHVTSTTPKKTFQFIGDSTAAGNWVDGNGIPAGITLSFDAEFTITALPTGSYLTNPGASGSVLGRGIGVTQTFGPTGLNDINLGDGLDFSAVTVSNVNFAGTLADTNYQFNSGDVSDFGPIVFRSGVFQEENHGMVLTRGSDTIGYGLGTGSVASNLIMNNNFGPPTGDSSLIPRQTGPFTFVVSHGVGAIKGILMEYDITYDITSATGGDADFNGDDVVDGADFLIWQRNVDKTTGATQSQGNANPAVDGAVNGEDLAIWKSQFGSAAAAAQAVPEPAGAVLLVAGAVAALAGRRRWSQR